MNKNIAVTIFVWMMFSSYLATSTIAQGTEMKLADNTIILSDRSDRNNPIISLVKDQQKDNIAKILIILGLVSTVGFVGWGISRRGNVPVADPTTKGSKKTKRALLDQVSPRLRRKLLRLVNDPKTANRLLMGIHKYNRDRSPNWLAEKAIYDLRRGR